MSIFITLSSSFLFFSTVASAPYSDFQPQSQSHSSGEQQYFETYTVTTKVNDFGLCLKDVPGCLSISTSSRSCKSPAIIGPLEGIGTDESQQWTYKNGLLKNNQKSSIGYWYNSKNVYGCLGLPRGIYELNEGNEYPLIRRSCPCNDQDAPQYMQFVINNGLIQSLAPVVVSNNKRALQEEDDETDKTTPMPFCVTINEAAENGASSDTVEGALVTLKQCNYNQDENPTQSFIPFGYRQPFLQSTQDVWGKKDIIHFAFDLGTYHEENEEQDKDNNKKIVIDLFNYDDAPEDSPVYQIEHELQQGEEEDVSSSSGIITFDISNTGLPSGKYKAKFHDEYDDNNMLYGTTNFIISPSEKHVTCGSGGYYSSFYNDNNLPSSSIGFIFCGSIIGAIIGLVCCVTCCNKKKKQRATIFSPGIQQQHDDDDATVLTAMDEEKGNKNNDDDDTTTTDTHSQSSVSQD